MNNSSRTEPTAIVVSMALTTLAATYINSIASTWQRIVTSLMFILAGTSTTQLYWSLIIPLLRDQLDVPLGREGKTKNKFLGQLVSFYFQVSGRLIIGRCTVKEMRLLGYLNGLAAFLILFLGQLLLIVDLLIWVKPQR